MSDLSFENGNIQLWSPLPTMAKLWCPICKTCFPNQADINGHLQQVHSRAKRLEWADFADHPDGKDVPTTLLDEDLAREMMFMHGIDEDSTSDAAPLEDEGQTEDIDMDTTTRLSTGARGRKRSRAVRSRKSSSSSSSNSGKESSRKHRLQKDDIQQKLVELEKAPHDYKAGRRLGLPNSSIQQELASLPQATEEDLDDDQSNDADDERERSEESDDADHERGEEATQTMGDKDR